jgi:outer membrane lipoprotein carrier protein
MLKKRIIGAIAFAAALMPVMVNAAALAQFKSFAASTQSARGVFLQHLVKDGAQVKPSSGNFVFARPGKFIWTYSKPYEQILQSDGTTLFIYDKDLNQVTTRKLGDALGSSPAAILFGSNDLDKNFVLKEAGTHDGLEWLEATPKSKDSTFASIEIGMKDGVPAQMALHDAFGQTSMLTFEQFEKNPPLKATSFEFVIPKGADVLAH